MTKKSKAQKNLVLARFLRPDYEWTFDTTVKADESWDVHSKEYGTFGMRHHNCCAQVIMKLKQAHNITINERTRDGQTEYQAVSQDGVNMRGRQWHSDLGELLVQIIEGLK